MRATRATARREDSALAAHRRSHGGSELARERAQRAGQRLSPAAEQQVGEAVDEQPGADPTEHRREQRVPVDRHLGNALGRQHQLVAVLRGLPVDEPGDRQADEVESVAGPQRTAAGRPICRRWPATVSERASRSAGRAIDPAAMDRPTSAAPSAHSAADTVPAPNDAVPKVLLPISRAAAESDQHADHAGEQPSRPGRSARASASTLRGSAAARSRAGAGRRRRRRSAP